MNRTDTEHAIERLNTRIIAKFEEIDILEREVVKLKEQLDSEGK